MAGKREGNCADENAASKRENSFCRMAIVVAPVALSRAPAGHPVISMDEQAFRIWSGADGYPADHVIEIDAACSIAMKATACPGWKYASVIASHPPRNIGASRQPYE